MFIDSDSRQAIYEETLCRLLGRKPEELPSLPATAIELLKVTNRWDTSAEDLVRVIRQDPSLATRLVRIANSPVYTTGERVTDLSRAVVILGFPEVARIGAGLSILAAAGGDKPIRRRIARYNLWRHSQAVGTICNILARDLLGWGPGFYMFGLIHDIGKVAVDSYQPAKFTQILKTIDQQAVDWVQAENQILLADHGFVGLSLLASWELPEQIVQSVGNHHQPWEAGEHQELAAMIFLADYIARAQGFYALEAEKKINLPSTLDRTMIAFLKSLPWTMEALRSPKLRAEIKRKIADTGQSGL